jgi:predicted nucleic acid-binding protein
MKVVLDTNVLSELVKPAPNASVSQMILDAPAGSLFASEVTRYELRYGALMHPRPEHLWARIQALILPIPTWLNVTAEISERTAVIAATLDRHGRPIGAIDPFIAATAFVLGCPVVTCNVRNFEIIEGLQVINWHLER